jgi:hypothetical protein
LKNLDFFSCIGFILYSLTFYFLWVLYYLWAIMFALIQSVVVIDTPRSDSQGYRIDFFFHLDFLKSFKIFFLIEPVETKRKWPLESLLSWWQIQLEVNTWFTTKGVLTGHLQIYILTFNWQLLLQASLRNTVLLKLTSLWINWANIRRGASSSN